MSAVVDDPLLQATSDSLGQLQGKGPQIWGALAAIGVLYYVWHAYVKVWIESRKTKEEGQSRIFNSDGVVPMRLRDINESAPERERKRLEAVLTQQRKLSLAAIAAKDAEEKRAEKRRLKKLGMSEEERRTLAGRRLKDGAGFDEDDNGDDDDDGEGKRKVTKSKAFKDTKPRLNLLSGQTGGGNTRYRPSRRSSPGGGGGG